MGFSRGVRGGTLAVSARDGLFGVCSEVLQKGPAPDRAAGGYPEDHGRAGTVATSLVCTVAVASGRGELCTVPVAVTIRVSDVARTEAQRTPRLLFRFDGSFLLRSRARTLAASVLFQLPPR